jgi:succinate dehydrogenase / fumarate reductase cytochrome b subunit
MLNLKDVLTSSIGKKVLNGLTAVALVFFVIGHLGGNLTLLISPEAFNGYAAKLHSLGGLLYVIEILLLTVIVVHAGLGITLAIQNSEGRTDEYRASQKSKGGPSNYNLSSTTMIISGVVLLFFLILHIIQFRLAPYWRGDEWKQEVGLEAGVEYYEVLYAMVDHAFAQPIWVVTYSVVMLFLGLHLRHGIWSMLQTIGAMNNRWKKSIYGLALVLAIILGAGFLILPVGIYFEVFPLGGV